MSNSGAVHIRLTPQLLGAISDAAKRRGMTVSTWMRQAAMTVAVLEGVLSPDIQVTDGRRRYARIEGGAIVDIRYLTDDEENS